jgi:hypothetical protein
MYSIMQIESVWRHEGLKALDEYGVYLNECVDEGELCSVEQAIDELVSGFRKGFMCGVGAGMQAGVHSFIQGLTKLN